MSGNYIKIHRKMLEWEWYQNEHTKNVFLHCLLKANWKEGRFEGKVIPKGSFVTSVKRIALELDLTEEEVRCALNRLIKTGEITKQTTNKYTVITVSNYDIYQKDPKQTPNETQTNTNASPDNPQTNTKLTPKEPQTNTKLTPTIEEGKKERRKEGKQERREEENIKTVSDETVCQTDVQRIVGAWNELEAYGIKPITRLASSSQRYQRLTARIKQYSADEVLSAIDRVKSSDFLQGKNNRGWVISFDWFVLPNNFPKVLEGNYDNRKGGQGYQSQTAQMLDQSYDMMADWVKKKEMEEAQKNGV